MLKACLDLGPLAAFDPLTDEEVLDLLKLLLRVLVVLLFDRLGAVGLVTGGARLIGQLMLVLLVLQPQLPLAAPVAVAGLDPLEAVLDLADQLLQVVGLELLVELLDPVLDGLVQLHGLRLGDWQVAHEL